MPSVAVHERQGPRGQPCDSEHGDVVDLVERYDARIEENAVVPVDAGSLDPRDDVGVRHDQPGPCDPARSLDPEAAGSADDPHDAERSPFTPAVRRIAGSGASTPAAGPASAANGSIEASLSMSRLGGNSSLRVDSTAESWA